MLDEPLRPDDADLDALVFEFLEQADSAERASDQVLADLCLRRPELAEALRGRVEVLLRSGLWRAQDSGSAAPLEQIGEFRLLRKLGGGGMGVVYLAEQPSVGRRVALKLVRAEHLCEPTARARFLREVRAIARLDHPSIVRVFAMGEERGVPYLTMEYVRGAALDSVLDRLAGRVPASLSGEDARQALLAELAAASEDTSTDLRVETFSRGWVEFAVRVARDVALALEHAHERGVLHRDLKPSNLLVSADGRVLLCDFGLAALSDADSLTRSGALMGSLPYMAPEQLRGDAAAIGPATDVYGLGVTLYELVTLVRPYDGATGEGVRAAVLEARPRAMHELNPAASIDIERVCAKALDPDPRRRYASAADFARDLSNVLELRPIEARPPSTAVRIRRWVQRRPAAAVALVGGALLLVVGPLGWELNRRQTMEDVRAAYEREQLAHERSERDFRSALRAVGHVLRGLASEDLRDVPRMQRARLTAIERAQSLFDELHEGRGSDAELLSEGADLQFARGEVLHDLGRQEEAVAAFQEASHLLERLALLDPTRDVRLRVASANSQRGKALQAQGRWSESLEPLERTEELTREILGGAPDSHDASRALVVALANRSESLSVLGEGGRALALLEEAFELVERLAAAAPASPDVVWTLGRVCGDLGLLARARGELENALELHERQLAAHRRAHELAPERRYYRFDVATAQIALATVLTDSRRTSESEALLLAAGAELDALLVDYPDAERYAQERSRVEQGLAALYGRSGRLADALEIFRASAERIGRRADSALERADLAVFAAQAQFNVALTEVHSGAPLERTLAALDGVLARLDAARGSDYDDGITRQLRALTSYTRALALCLSDELDAAIEEVERVDHACPDDATQLRHAADLWNELILTLRRVESDAYARVTLESEWTKRMFTRLDAAVEAGYADLAELDSTPALDSFRDSADFKRIRERCARRVE